MPLNGILVDETVAIVSALWPKSPAIDPRRILKRSDNNFLYHFIDHVWPPTIISQCTTISPSRTLLFISCVYLLNPLPSRMGTFDNNIYSSGHVSQLSMEINGMNECTAAGTWNVHLFSLPLNPADHWLLNALSVLFFKIPWFSPSIEERHHCLAF